MTKSEIKQYIIILAMYLVSGTFAFYMRYSGLAILSYFILVLYFVFIRFLKPKKTLGLNFLLFFSIWEIVNFFIINNNHVSDGRETMIICHILFCISSYLTISSFNFYEFKKIYLNISVIFATIGLIAFILVTFNLSHYVIYDNIKMYLFQNLGWAGERTPRLAGVFWEPGAYQIVILLCLILYWNDIIENKITKTDWYKFIILIFAFLATQSSWGYVCIAYYIFTISVGKKNSHKNIIKYGVTFSILIIGIYYLLSSSVILGKLAQADNTKADTSYSIRLNDNLALIKMIEEKPLFGYGISTVEFDNRSRSLDNRTSSNGLLQMGATLGVIMLIVYLFYTYKAAKLMFPQKRNLIFPLFLLLQLMEVFYYFPLSYILLFPFKSYKSYTRNLIDK